MNDNPTPAAAETDAGTAPPNLDEFLGAPARPLWQRRGAMIAGLVLLLLAILLLSRCFAGSAEAGYATEEVRRGDLTVTISATGNLLPTNQVEIGSEQSGLITDVYVDNNDQVTKGQPLARLDTSRLRDTIIQNEAALAAVQAQVAQANATAVQARANLARLEQVWRVSGRQGAFPARARHRPRREPARHRRRSRRAGPGDPGPRRAFVLADQSLQGDHLFAGHRSGAVAAGRSRPDRGRLALRPGAVRDRRGSQRR